MTPSTPVTWTTGPASRPLTLTGHVIATNGATATVRANGEVYEVALSALCHPAHPAPPATPNACCNCGHGRIKAQGRCDRCYQYFYRHGTERPATVQPLRFPAGFFTACQNCGATPIEAKGRCKNCYCHLRRRGSERTRIRSPLCANCGRDRTPGKRRCTACDAYWWRAGVERPERFWARPKRNNNHAHQ
jgi:hypothetical protein